MPNPTPTPKGSCCEKCSKSREAISQLNPFAKTIWYCSDKSCPCHSPKVCCEKKKVVEGLEVVTKDVELLLKNLNERADIGTYVAGNTFLGLPLRQSNSMPKGEARLIDRYGNIIQRYTFTHE